MSKPTKLKKISTVIGSGITPSRTNMSYWENGVIPWLKTEQLGEHEIYDTNEKITQTALNETSIKVFPENTLSLAMYGEGRTRGNVSILKRPMTTNQACCNIVIDEKKADYEFVYYFLKTQYQQLRSLSSGVRKNLNSNDIKEFEINLPEEIKTQRQIASVLSCIDSKIALNNRINAELEAMAKTVYDYWFVQFDFPFDFAQGKPSVEGKPYKSSGGKMVWSEELKREVPEGWEVSKIGKLLRTSLGGTPSTTKKEYWENGTISWLNSGEIANFPIIDSELKITEAAIKNSATDLLPKGCVMLSITRHLRPSILGIDACANQSVIGIKESGDLKCYFLYPYLQNEIPRLMSMRSGAQQPHINKEVVDESFILTPPDNSSILKSYNSKVGNIYESIINNAFQNQQLSSLRDWLLPMLMNGQVKPLAPKGEQEMEVERLMAAEPEFEYKK